MEFLKWMMAMGYLSEEDVEEDGIEIVNDLEKVKEVAPKFYNLIKTTFTIK